MKFTPLYDKIVVVPDKAEERITAGGIIIPDTVADKPQTGLVEAAGNGWIDDNNNLRAMSVKVGDRVLYGKYAGTEVKINNEARLIMREADVIGILINE